MMAFANRAPLLLPDPWRRHTEMRDGSLENVAARATTITKVMKRILAHTEPVPHGGINE